ncbi:MAG: hypothetical protein WBZ36_23565, partial [Candidatus Nitrosopolaris sp.]
YIRLWVKNMNKLLGFGLLFAILVLVSVSSVTVKKASAIYFGNGACASGEARDYMGDSDRIQSTA